MASLKQTLRANQKILFWGGTALVVVVGLVCWFLSTKGLAGVYDSRTRAIDQSANVAKGRIKQDPHPNEITIASFAKSVNAVKKSVRDNWKIVYDAQKEAIYKWPTAGLTPELQEAFRKLSVDFVKNPSAKDIADNPEKYEIPLNLREQYPKYIREQFPKLVQLVDAQWFKDAEPDGHGPKGADTAKKSGREYKVEWPDQKKIQARFEMTETPTTSKIVYLQEDLWVLKAFCDIIASLNFHSKGRHDAVVWIIQGLDIGPAGVESSPGGLGENRVARGQTAAPAAAGGVPKPEATSKTPAPTIDASADGDLKGNRYVTLDGKPLSAADLLAPPTEDKKYLLQYRLMPFKLRLVMDERKIDDLLVELRTAVLPIEVRQVRINVGSKAGDEHGELKKLSPYAMSVELRGVIYLANPPDETLLKTDEPAGEAPADAAPKPVAKPAEAPVAGTTPPGDAPVNPAPADGRPADAKSAAPAPGEAPATTPAEKPPM